MSKYDEKTDLELSAMVAKLIYDECIIYGDNVFVRTEYDGDSVISIGGIFSINNPADMWPIMFAKNISVINIKNTTQWFACTDVEFENICMSPDGSDSGISSMYAKHEHYCTNPLRAAAILFLMMKDAE